MFNLFKRFIAYFIDMMVVLIIVQTIASIPVLNKQLDKYNDIYNNYLEKKKLTQPLNTYNAGSTFKNPPNNSAWKLIKDTVGNISVEDALVSTIHANFLINKKNATFNDMKTLITTIQDEVLKKHHILLEPEWVIIE